jgi:hypothetical protein
MPDDVNPWAHLSDAELVRRSSQGPLDASDLFSARGETMSRSLRAGLTSVGIDRPARPSRQFAREWPSASRFWCSGAAGR